MDRTGQIIIFWSGMDRQLACQGRGSDGVQALRHLHRAIRSVPYLWIGHLDYIDAHATVCIAGHAEYGAGGKNPFLLKGHP